MEATEVKQKSDILISQEQIKTIVEKIGIKINDFYKNEYSLNEPLIIIGLLKGSFIFMADLVRELKIDTHIEFMTISSYNNENIQEKELRIISDLNISISGRDVLLIDDILDTGRCFSKVIELLNSRNPKSLKTCALLNKQECRIVEVPIDFYGIDIEDKFVYGYGLDDAQSNRHLPYIGVKNV